jgi:hypothetical protein
VNYYGAGCYYCGGWHAAGAAAVGVTAAAAGTAVAMSAGAVNTAAAATSAYAAGVAAGSAIPTVYPMNAIYPTIPAGCTTPNVGGTTYFLCGNTWFQPFDGANGIYYRVVPTP